MKTTAKSLLNQIESALTQAYDLSESNSIGKIVMEEVIGVPRHQLPLNQSLELSGEQEVRLDKVMSRLLNKEPIQYVIGSCHFYGLEFKVNPGVLIPRPETEELVDLIINKHQGHIGLRVADIGTGSGCIAISLAANLTSSKVTAADVSKAALAITQANATDNKVKVTCKQLDILSEVLPSSSFDIIVSNPPYITYSERELMHENVLDHEPGLALFVPNDHPLKFYEAIAKQGMEVLRNAGWIYCEINEHYGAETIQLFESHGYQKVALHQDMQGKDRMICCQKA